MTSNHLRGALGATALLLAAGCAPQVVERPLTAAEKEAIIREVSMQQLAKDAQAGVRPSCAASTRLSRYRARATRESGADGFGSKGCPAGGDY